MVRTKQKIFCSATLYADGNTAKYLLIYKIYGLSTIIHPLMILFVGLMVEVIAKTLYLPICQVEDAVKQKVRKNGKRTGCMTVGLLYKRSKNC